MTKRRKMDLPPTASGSNRKQFKQFAQPARVKMRLKRVEFWTRP